VPNFLIEKLVNSSLSWINRYERSVSRFIGFQEIRVVMSPQKQLSK
jgi:hypothetical protein